MTKQKKIKNIIYKVCGIGMIGSFLLFLLNLTPIAPYNLTWIIEAIALFFFGLSWIVKSDAFPFLQDHENDSLEDKAKYLEKKLQKEAQKKGLI